MSQSTKGYFQVNRRTFESKAFRALSVTARAAYLELGVLFLGSNNGAISLGARRLSERLGVGRSTAARALAELVDAKIVEVSSVGSWGETPKAACYRLTDRKCDVSGMRAGQPSNVVEFTAQAKPVRSPAGGTDSPAGGTSLGKNRKFR